MFHTKYKFDIMSESDILSEITTCRSREAFFTLLLNDPTYYETEKRKLSATIDRAMNQLAHLEESKAKAPEAVDLERQTIQALYRALEKKLDEKKEKEKLARLTSAANRGPNEAKKPSKSSEERFQEKLKQIPEDVLKSQTMEFWRAILA